MMNKESIYKYLSLEKLLVFIVFLISCIFYNNSPSQYVADDSLFYIVIAQHIIDSGVSTFNNYISTNGYHPLWMLFNMIGVKTSSLLSVDSLFIVGIIYQIFMLGSIYIIFKIGNEIKTFSASITSIILIFLFISNGILQNMESALALFFVLLSLYIMLIKKNQSKIDLFTLGIILGLTLLSRLDLIFYGLSLVFIILYKNKKVFISSPITLFCFVSGGLIIVLPYFIFNEFNFGSITPISGALKSSFPNIEFSYRNIFPYGIVSAFFALISLLIGIQSDSYKTRFIFFLLSISTIVHIIYLAAFQSAMTWYFITGFLNFSLVIGYFFQHIQYKFIKYFIFLFIIFLTILTSYMKSISDFTISTHLLLRKHLNYSNESQMKKFSVLLMEKLPREASIFTWDVPGILAYYGGFRVFSADGLITNKAYQKELLKEGARAVFEKYKISYLLVPLTKGRAGYYDGMKFEPVNENKYLITIYTRLYHKRVGQLLLSNDDIVIRMRSPYAGTDKSSPLIGIFKITNKNNIWIK